MTEQQPQDQPAAPPPESPPPASPPPVNWAATARPEAAVPGASGLVYADVPNRIIALIIDVIILAIIGIIASIVVSAILGPPVDIVVTSSGIETRTNIVSTLVNLVISLAISAVYWIYSWTALRASPGQKVLGMQVGNFPDGRTLTQDQAIRRWVALGGPLPIVQALNPLPLLGVVIGLATLVYFIYLLWSTAQSPTKRGFHDIFANSVVVKAARAV